MGRYSDRHRSEQHLQTGLGHQKTTYPVVAGGQVPSDLIRRNIRPSSSQIGPVTHSGVTLPGNLVLIKEMALPIILFIQPSGQTDTSLIRSTQSFPFTTAPYTSPSINTTQHSPLITPYTLGSHIPPAPRKLSIYEVLLNSSSRLRPGISSLARKLEDNFHLASSPANQRESHHQQPGEDEIFGYSFIDPASSSIRGPPYGPALHSQAVNPLSTSPLQQQQQQANSRPCSGDGDVHCGSTWGSPLSSIERSSPSHEKSPEGIPKVQNETHTFEAHNRSVFGHEDYKVADDSRIPMPRSPVRSLTSEFDSAHKEGEISDEDSRWGSQQGNSGSSPWGSLPEVKAPDEQQDRSEMGYGLEAELMLELSNLSRSAVVRGCESKRPSRLAVSTTAWEGGTSLDGKVPLKWPVGGGEGCDAEQDKGLMNRRSYNGNPIIIHESIIQGSPMKSPVVTPAVAKLRSYHTPQKLVEEVESDPSPASLEGSSSGETALMSWVGSPAFSSPATRKLQFNQQSGLSNYAEQGGSHVQLQTPNRGSPAVGAKQVVDRDRVIIKKLDLDPIGYPDLFQLQEQDEQDGHVTLRYSSLSHDHQLAQVKTSSPPSSSSLMIQIEDMKRQLSELKRLLGNVATQSARLKLHSGSSLKGALTEEASRECKAQVQQPFNLPLAKGNITSVASKQIGISASEAVTSALDLASHVEAVYRVVGLALEASYIREEEVLPTSELVETLTDMPILSQLESEHKVGKSSNFPVEKDVPLSSEFLVERDVSFSISPLIHPLETKFVQELEDATTDEPPISPMMERFIWADDDEIDSKGRLAEQTAAPQQSVNTSPDSEDDEAAMRRKTIDRGNRYSVLTVQTATAKKDLGQVRELGLVVQQDFQRKSPDIKMDSSSRMASAVSSIRPELLGKTRTHFKAHSRSQKSVGSSRKSSRAHRKQEILPTTGSARLSVGGQSFASSYDSSMTQTDSLATDPYLVTNMVRIYPAAEDRRKVGRISHQSGRSSRLSHQHLQHQGDILLLSQKPQPGDHLEDQSDQGSFDSSYDSTWTRTNSLASEPVMASGAGRIFPRPQGPPSHSSVAAAAIVADRALVQAQSEGQHSHRKLPSSCASSARRSRSNRSRGSQSHRSKSKRSRDNHSQRAHQDFSSSYDTDCTSEDSLYSDPTSPYIVSASPHRRVPGGTVSVEDKRDRLAVSCNKDSRRVRTSHPSRASLRSKSSRHSRNSRDTREDRFLSSYDTDCTEQSLYSDAQSPYCVSASPRPQYAASTRGPSTEIKRNRGHSRGSRGSRQSAGSIKSRGSKSKGRQGKESQGVQYYSSSYDSDSSEESFSSDAKSPYCISASPRPGETPAAIRRRVSTASRGSKTSRGSKASRGSKGSKGSKGGRREKTRPTYQSSEYDSDTTEESLHSDPESPYRVQASPRQITSYCEDSALSSSQTGQMTSGQMTSVASQQLYKSEAVPSASHHQSQYSEEKCLSSPFSDLSILSDEDLRLSSVKEMGLFQDASQGTLPYNNFSLKDLLNSDDIGSVHKISSDHELSLSQAPLVLMKQEGIIEIQNTKELLEALQEEAQQYSEDEIQETFEDMYREEISEVDLVRGLPQHDDDNSDAGSYDMDRKKNSLVPHRERADVVGASGSGASSPSLVSIQTEAWLMTANMLSPDRSATSSLYQYGRAIAMGQACGSHRSTPEEPVGSLTDILHMGKQPLIGKLLHDALSEIRDHIEGKTPPPSESEAGLLSPFRPRKNCDGSRGGSGGVHDTEEDDKEEEEEEEEEVLTPTLKPRLSENGTATPSGSAMASPSMSPSGPKPSGLTILYGALSEAGEGNVDSPSRLWSHRPKPLVLPRRSSGGSEGISVSMLNPMLSPSGMTPKTLAQIGGNGSKTQLGVSPRRGPNPDFSLGKYVGMLTSDLFSDELYTEENGWVSNEATSSLSPMDINSKSSQNYLGQEDGQTLILAHRPRPLDLRGSSPPTTPSRWSPAPLSPCQGSTPQGWSNGLCTPSGRTKIMSPRRSPYPSFSLSKHLVIVASSLFDEEDK